MRAPSRRDFPMEEGLLILGMVLTMLEISMPGKLMERVFLFFEMDLYMMEDSKILYLKAMEFSSTCKEKCNMLGYGKMDLPRARGKKFISTEAHTKDNFEGESSMEKEHIIGPMPKSTKDNSRMDS